MTAATTVYTNAPKNLLASGLDAGTLKCMFVTATYVPDQDAHDFVNDVNTNEAAGTSYVAGGPALTGVILNVDTTANTVTLDADDITTAGLSVSCRWGILYVDTGTPATSFLIAYVDFSQGVGGNVTVTGVQWDTAGIVPFAVAA